MTYDSYIFDMDGTLWDAVDGYCDVWNAAIGSFGIDCPRIDRERLFTQMGKPLDAIMDALIPGDFDREAFMKRLAELEADIVPRCGGTLYPHVKDVLGSLRKQGARIFLVSNCGAPGHRQLLQLHRPWRILRRQPRARHIRPMQGRQHSPHRRTPRSEAPRLRRRHTARRGFGPRSRHSSHLGRLRIRNRRRS